MVDSGDAGPSQKFRDHTQLIKTSKQALTLTEHNFFDSTDFYLAFPFEVDTTPSIFSQPKIAYTRSYVKKL